MIKQALLLIACLIGGGWAMMHAQQTSHQQASTYLKQAGKKLNLSQADIEHFVVTDHYTSKHNGVTHIYLQQTHAGIPVRNSHINMNIWKGKVVSLNNGFVPNLAQQVQTTQPGIQADRAIMTAAKAVDQHLALPLIKMKSKTGSQLSALYTDSEMDSQLIPVELEYVKQPDGTIVLSWKTEIVSPKKDHHWHIWVDATTGKVLDKSDQVIHCHWGITDGWGDQLVSKNRQAHQLSHQKEPLFLHPLFGPTEIAGVMGANEYRVFPLPIESPNHGQHAFVPDPADTLASPFGWHDTDGIAGPEYTITRGNNVWAQENRDGNSNTTGQSPDGGPTLDFNANYNPSLGPAANVDAATTNLFYWNNLNHDIWYRYGFDEVSGNYQVNNYGRGGRDDDEVIAFSQDGRGNNNAFFVPSSDGFDGQLAMFLFTSNDPADYLTVLSPENVSGAYQSIGASFGGAIPDTMLTANIVLVDDGTGNDQGCNALTNDSLIAGNFALIDRGGCSFTQKVQIAQDAGAVAAIVINDQPGPPVAMSGASNTITIPAIMITQAAGNDFKAALANDSIRATLLDPGNLNGKDASFDNGIITHEYGHGVSNRLTGGPAATGCLSNSEQAGEGWSDWLGLVLTAKPGDTGPMRRGIGTFAIGEAVTGNGFREFPYSTDLSINPHTYDDVRFQRFGSFVSVHGVGSIMCAMLWELYWGLVDEYGFDADLLNGTGGNNIAIQLVMDGMKLQPCLPGFIDVRDAILLADEINYGGANKCIIWRSFAKRGLGFSASQGSSNSITDGVEAFDIPIECSTVLVEKNAANDEVFPGGTISYTLDIANNTDGNATNVVVRDTLPLGTTFVEGSNTCPATFSNGVLTIDVDPLAPGGTASCKFDIKVDPNADISTFSFKNDIEDGTTGFVVLNQLGQTKWSLDSLRPRSGKFAWFVQNDTLENDQVLQLPSMNLSGSPVLTFWHLFNTESKLDGGVIEILPTASGNQWVDLGPHILREGYRDTLLGINPGSGRPAFTGNSSIYVQTQVDLSSFVNQLVFIRFRFFSNNSNQAEGWWVDDISVGELKGITNTACISSDQTSSFCATQPFETLIVQGWPTAIDPDPNVSVELFPNPAKQEVQLRLESQEASELTISLVNIHGQQVYQKPLQVRARREAHTLQLANLSRGIYMVEITSASGRTVRKLVLE